MTIQPTKGRQSILRPDTIPLGFGCSGLMHGRNQNESLRLLETAIDCGITYFDTARMYGFGRAEGILGTAARHRRDRLTIASKAGILPGSRSLPARVLHRGIRVMHKAAPQLQRYMQPPAPPPPRAGFFDVQNIRKSVETSLKEIRTDYLDILLLHECTEADVAEEDLLDLLQRLKEEGKIRAFGLATGLDETLRILKVRPQLGAVVQIASSIWNMNITRLPPRADGDLTITHSALTSRFRELTRRLASDDALARQWEAALDIDAADKEGLARLLLMHALHLNADGVVLFSSGNAENIRSNVQAIRKGSITASQINGLSTLLENHMLPLEGTHQDYLRVS